MNLLGVLFRGGSAPASVAPAARQQHSPRPAANAAQTVQVRLNAAQLLIRSGSYTELHIDGPIVARTSNGSIDAVDLHGTARLSTRTGDIRVSGECGPLTVRSQSGDVTLDCSITAHTTLETHKGNLELKLGPQTNAHIEA